MFSNLADDNTLKDLKLNRIKIDDDLINDPLTVKDFKDSLVLFDEPRYTSRISNQSAL